MGVMDVCNYDGSVGLHVLKLNQAVHFRYVQFDA